MADRPVLKLLSRTVAGNVPSVNVTTGGARNIAQVANLFSLVAQDVGQHADAVVSRRAQEAGALAGLRGTPDIREGNSIRDRAFNDAALSSMALRIDVETKGRLDELFQENRADPQGFQFKAEAHIREVADTIEDADPTLAEVYRIKSGVLIQSTLKNVQKNADVVQGDMKEANFQRSLNRFGDDLPQYLDDIVSGDTDAVEQAAALMTADLGALLTTARTQKFSDGTPMRTEAEIAGMERDFREVAAASTVQSMIQNADTVEGIKQIIQDLGDNKLQLKLVEFSEQGPGVVAGIPLDVFDAAQVDSLQKFGFSQIRGIENLDAESDLKAQQEQLKAGVAAVNQFRTKGVRPQVDTSLMTETQVLGLEDAFADAGREFEAVQEFDRSTPVERQARILEMESRTDFDSLERSKKMRMVDARMNEALVLDPTQEIYRQNPQLLDVEDPEERAELIAEESRRQGLFESDIRYATNQQIDVMANALRQPGASGEDLILVMKSVEALFGSKFANVLHEAAKLRKVNPAVGVLQNLVLRTAEGEVNIDAITFADIVTSGVTSGEMRKNLESEDKAKGIDEGIRQRIAEFTQTLQPNQLGMVEVYREAATLLAYQFGINDGTNDSVERAFEAILPYEFRGSVRIPKNVVNRSIRDAVERVDALTDMAVARGAVIIDESQLGGISKEKVREEIIKSVKNTGSISISELEDGVVVLDFHGVPMQDASGRPIVITWDELERADVLGLIEKDIAEATSLGASRGLSF